MCAAQESSRDWAREHGASQLMQGTRVNFTRPVPSVMPGNKILSNVLSLSSGDVFSRIVAFGATAYLTRQLGPAGFGVIGFVLAIQSYFALVTTGGSNAVATREIARRPHDASVIALSVILVRVLLSCLAIGAMAIIAWLIDKPLATKLVIVLASLSFLSLAIDTSWVLKGLERNRPVAISLVLAQTLFVLLVLVFVHGPGDVVLVPVAQFAGEFTAAGVLAMLVFRGPLKVDFTDGLRVLRGSGHVFVSKILRAVIFNFDVLLLGFLLGDHAVGLYVAPYRFCFMLLSIAVAIHASYLPALVRAARSGPVALVETANRALAFSAAVAAPLIVGGIAVARPLLQILFGSEYVDGTLAFQILILSIGLIFLHGHLFNLFLVRDRTSTLTRIIAVATAINIPLNFLLIPAWGIAGAAASTVAAEAFIFLAGALILRASGVRVRLYVIWRPTLAASVMGAALFVVRTQNSLVISVVVGVIVYAASLILLRGIPEDMRVGIWSKRAA